VLWNNRSRDWQQVRGISRNHSVTPAGKPRRKVKLLPARLRLHGRLSAR